MPLPDLSPALVQSALAVAAIAFIAGLARGFSGFGAALIFIPPASAIFGPIAATPIYLITDALTSGPLFLHALGRCSFRQIRFLALGALIGFPLGAHVLTSSDPETVRWIVTCLILASLAVLASGWRWSGPVSDPMTCAVGVVSGSMSGLAQIGGPPVVIYWLAMDTAAAVIRANLMVYFMLLNLMGVTIFASKGLFSASVFWLGLAGAPFYALGMFIGARMFPLASEVTFRRIAFLLVALAALTSIPALDPILRGR